MSKDEKQRPERFMGLLPSIAQQMSEVGLTMVSIKELEELRALKRKIDSIVWTGRGVAFPDGAELIQMTYAGTFLAWLREPE